MCAHSGGLGDIIVIWGIRVVPFQDIQQSAAAAAAAVRAGLSTKRLIPAEGRRNVIVLILNRNVAVKREGEESV